VIGSPLSHCAEAARFVVTYAAQVVVFTCVCSGVKMEFSGALYIRCYVCCLWSSKSW